MDLSSSGKTIAKLRKSAGFTQASLAERLGISDKAVSKWERGMSFPDTSLLNRLCILLDTDIVWTRTVKSWDGNFNIR